MASKDASPINKLKYFLRVIRIEPIISTWKVEVIPFNYTRFNILVIMMISHNNCEHPP